MADIPTVSLQITFWKRPEVTSFVFGYFAKQKERLTDQVKLEIISIGSEGRRSKNLARCFGFHYVEHDNLPLNFKALAGSRYAKRFDADVHVLCGSNDIIEDSYYLNMLTLMKEQGLEVAGTCDSYVYDVIKDKMLRWPGYVPPHPAADRRMGEPLGLGRVLSNRVMHQVNWELWSDTEPTSIALDGQCKAKLNALGHIVKGFQMSESGGLLQIKTGDDINDMDDPGIKELLQDMDHQKAEVFSRFKLKGIDLD